MGYVKVIIKSVAGQDELKRWEDRMMEKAKCWNKFCLGLCDNHKLRAVYVTKDGDEENIFLTTLCEDCIRDTTDYGILINDSHLILESHQR